MSAIKKGAGSAAVAFTRLGPFEGAFPGVSFLPLFSSFSSLIQQQYAGEKKHHDGKID